MCEAQHLNLKTSCHSCRIQHMQSGGKSHGESDSDLRSTLTVAELLIDNVIMSVINLIILSQYNSRTQLHSL